MDYTREFTLLAIATSPFVLATIIICYYETKEYLQNKKEKIDSGINNNS